MDRNAPAIPVISGIALNTFASGGTIFVLYLITGEKGASTSLSSLKLPSVTIPVVKDIPVIGTVLSGHHVLTYAALILVAVVWYMFKYTRLGMHIRAVGESPDAAESVGIPVKRIKYRTKIVPPEAKVFNAIPEMTALEFNFRIK